MSHSAFTAGGASATAERIVQVLDHLGVDRAHFAAQQDTDWIGLATAYPERMQSLTLICPAGGDANHLKELACRALIIYGDRPDVKAQIEQALDGLEGTQKLTLVGYPGFLWSNPVTDRLTVIRQTLLQFLAQVHASATYLPAITGSAEQGEISGIFYRTQGSGPPLVLMPLGLAPTQWDALLPILAAQYRTILLTGPELGILPLLEHRGRSPGYQRLLRGLIAQMQIKDGETILDVGCGTGVVDRWLARVTGGRNPLVGVDLNAYLLQEATALARREGLEATLSFQEGNAEALPFTDNHFDLVISTTVMEEVDAGTMLSEIVRVTKPGGRIGVIVRGVDLPRYTSVPLQPELKLKCEAPPPSSADEKGCASSDLYRRFRLAGLNDLCIMPDWTVFSDIDGVVESFLQRHMFARLSTEEASEWRNAAAQAAQEGIFFMTWPHHCAVGTKPF